MAYSKLVKPGQRIRLDDLDTAEDGGLTKEEGKQLTAELSTRLGELQELMFAAGETALLVVLQGRDTGGKDGAAKCLMRSMHAPSCRVVSFKAPTPDELARDFLWRVHREVPAKGFCTIFNRSHYEDVLVVRVRRLAPEKVWRPRYDRINDFERLLVENGTIVLKFFLHISREEQERRLLDREKDPVKAWKLNVEDWKDRSLWDSYTKAYEEALRRCSTQQAPWRIVPADRKWFRDLAIIEAVREALEPFRKRWMDRLERMSREARRELEEYRRSTGQQAQESATV
jgi:PPK2 family polyphosphate:nucleotide phosphotransferase